MVVTILLYGLTASAQETEKQSPFSGSVEMTTIYLWRGQEYGEALVFFPTLNYSISGFTVYATGALHILSVVHS